jgi:hypothetical protein
MELLELLTLLCDQSQQDDPLTVIARCFQRIAPTLDVLLAYPDFHGTHRAIGLGVDIAAARKATRGIATRIIDPSSGY